MLDLRRALKSESIMVTMTMTAAWVREGDIQAGPMVAEDGQGTHIHQVPEAGAVTGLKGNHDHAGSPAS